MKQRQMNPNRIQLGWFNAWIGLIWIYMLVKTLIFFINYNYFTKLTYSTIIISDIDIKISSDSSEMKIFTDKGTFYHYNRKHYNIIERSLKTKNPIIIYFDKDDNSISNISIDKKLILKSSKLANITYLVGLLFSALVTSLSVILLIKTRGWGTYDLLEKHRQKKKLKNLQKNVNN